MGGSKRFRNQVAKQEASNRRATRMSDEGRKFEQRVAKLLENLKSAGLITDYECFAPCSAQDYAGQDFMVQIIGATNEICSYPFGVTISIACWHSAQLKHCSVPQLCFPIGTKDETIKQRILELPKWRSIIH